jgi:hypothetical protein
MFFGGGNEIAETGTSCRQSAGCFRIQSHSEQVSTLPP